MVAGDMAGTSGAPAAGRVLVVDDNEGMREFIDLVLSDGGYEVVTVAHGQAALELLTRWRPDVILLDATMPIMDGREFARRYHALPAPHVPIVMLTADLDGAKRAEEVNAAAYLRKPFTPHDLLQLVSLQLVSRHAG
jgi:CheY-like chemotaxis protein